MTLIMMCQIIYRSVVFFYYLYCLITKLRIMKDISKSILLLLLSVLVLTSCEPDIDPVIPTDNGDTSYFDPEVHHFIDVVVDYKNGRGVEPRKRYGLTKVYLDSSVTVSQKQILDDLIIEINSIVDVSLLSFEYTNDINEFDIGIVFGEPTYMNEVFGTNTNPPSSWWGGTSIAADCHEMIKSYIWIDRDVEKLLKHEFLHALGLRHTDGGRSSIMFHSMGDAQNNMSEYDRAVLKLLYYEGDYGSVVEYIADDCSDDDRYLYEDEVKDTKEQLQNIIDNNYN